MAFAARFAQTCVICRKRIEPGDYIELTSERKGMHEECVPDEKLEAEPERPFVPSPRQQAFFDVLLKTRRSIRLDARAGSGKTRSVVEGTKLLYAEFPFLDVCAISFAKSTAETLGKKMPPNVKSSTTHALWFGVLQRYLERSYDMSNEANTKKVRQTARTLARAHKMPHGFEGRYLWPAIQLVEKAKEHGIGIPGCMDDTKESWLYVAGRHDIAVSGRRPDYDLIIAAARAVLEASNADLEHLDWADMLYLSAKLELQGPQFDVVMVDEAQDLNAVQRLLLHRMLNHGGRVIAVGDPFQACYGFRGADFDSMDLIAVEFDCVSLPLDICYRCATSVIKVAQEIVPTIYPATDAKQGLVSDCTDGWDITEFQPADRVICRLTAPLVDLGMRLLTKRIPFRILGKEFGDKLIDLVEKLKPLDLTDLLFRLTDYLAEEIPYLLSQDQDEQAQILEDRVMAVRAVVDALPYDEKSVDVLISEIKHLFAQRPEGVITLSTIHRAKGGEWERVFLLDRDLIPSKRAKTKEQVQQEHNLLYIAVTRSLDTLIYIKSESIQ